MNGLVANQFAAKVIFTPPVVEYPLCTWRFKVYIEEWAGGKPVCGYEAHLDFVARGCALEDGCYKVGWGSAVVHRGQVPNHLGVHALEVLLACKRGR